MIISLTNQPYAIIIRPNGIDAPWEIVEPYEQDNLGFFDTYNQALTYALDLAKRSGYAVAYSSGIEQPEKILFDFTKTN